MANLRLCLLLIIGCYLGSSNVLHAQKAKFKNQRVKVQKTRLPVNYVEPGNRTYDLYKKGAYSDNINAHDKGIYGWTLTQESPKLEAVVSLYGFSIPTPKRKDEKKSSKSKDGKVTKWTEYSYSGTATGNGTLYIYGEKNPFVYKKKNAKKSKAELKKEAEAAAKKKELEENPFLSADDVAEADEAESDISEDSGLDGALLPLVGTVKLDVSTSASTSSYKSRSAAYKAYINSERPKLSNFRNKYPASAYNKAIKTLNYKYGYSPVNYSVTMRKMKTEKHPEFKKWNAACQATETLFKKFKYNKSIDGNQAKFDPIIAYFSGMVEKYSEDDRKTKKIKKAAYHNLLNLLYYLDRHEAVITLGKKYQSSKLLDGLANKWINNSDKQVAFMAFHKVSSCHIETTVEVEEGEIESEEVEMDEEEGDGK